MELSKDDLKYDWQLISLVRNSLMPSRYCSVCKGKRPMVRFTERIWSDIKGGIFGKNLFRDTTRYRCQGCLSLWDEYEGKVKEE